MPKWRILVDSKRFLLPIQKSRAAPHQEPKDFCYLFTVVSACYKNVILLYNKRIVTKLIVGKLEELMRVGLPL